MFFNLESPNPCVPSGEVIIKTKSYFAILEAFRCPTGETVEVFNFLSKLNLSHQKRWICLDPKSARTCPRQARTVNATGYRCKHISSQDFTLQYLISQNLLCLIYFPFNIINKYSSCLKWGLLNTICLVDFTCLKNPIVLCIRVRLWLDSLV